MAKSFVKMADVAKAAGVSTMTVSRALRNDGSVSEARRVHIVKVANDIGYVFDRTASELRTGRTGFVAVTVPSINNPNFADSVRTLTRDLNERGLEVLLGYTDYSVEREETLIKQMLRRRPEAIVVTGSTHTPNAHALLKNAKIPVIENWDEPFEPIGVSVGFSNATAGAAMAKHLIDTGRRKIGFIGCDSETDFRGEARQNGFFATLAEHGLETHRLIQAGHPPLGASEGATAIKTMLDQYPDTDAVMCVADSVAFGAMMQLQRMGKRIPNDVAVAGFGAYDVSEMSIPPITTIDPNADRIGALTAAKIIQAIHSDAGTHVKSHADAEPELVARESTQTSPKN
ncbi:MAG: LacI family DNA-binding transcriptional regulator [Pseudomonadota bacterium]